MGRLKHENNILAHQVSICRTPDILLGERIFFRQPFLEKATGERSNRKNRITGGVVHHLDRNATPVIGTHFFFRQPIFRQPFLEKDTSFGENTFFGCRKCTQLGAHYVFFDNQFFDNHFWRTHLLVANV